MFDGRDAYLRFLRSQRTKIFYVYPYVGNSGDSLIRMGTMRLLTDLGIQSTLHPAHADMILWPGGNPTMWYANVQGWRDVLQKYAQAEFAVGPATFQYAGYDWLGVILRHTERVQALFARDPVSYQNLVAASLPRSITTGLAHDPAIYLRGSDWLEHHKAAATEDHVLVAFRADHEGYVGLSCPGRLVRRLLPAPLRRRVEYRWYRRSRQKKTVQALRRAAAGYPVRVADVAGYDFDSFVDAVLRAKEVHTDRLHTMLLAALFEKQVFAYSTAYGKLEAIYTHSLRDWAQIEFVSDTRLAIEDDEVSLRVAQAEMHRPSAT